MPLCCSVSTCKMNLHIAQETGKKISFFCVPKETNLRDIWIKRCNRKNSMSAKRPRVCSLHFRPEDFERDLRSELQNLPPKLILKKGALPTLNLGEYRLDLEESVVEPNTTNNDESILTSPNLHEKVINKLDTNAEDKEEILILLNAENLRLKQTIMQQQLKIRKYRKNINSLQTVTRQQQRSISLLRGENFEGKMRDRFKNIFTPKQLEVILKNKKIVHWQEEDYERASKIRGYSNNCYNYLRNKLHYPLPGISTLQSWASKQKQ